MFVMESVPLRLQRNSAACFRLGHKHSSGRLRLLPLGSKHLQTLEDFPQNCCGEARRTSALFHGLIRGELNVNHHGRESLVLQSHRVY